MADLQEPDAQKYAEFIIKVWNDPEFKKRFLAAPADVLRAEGWDPPHDCEIRVVENEPGVAYFLVPQNPDRVDLTADQIDEVFADSAWWAPNGWF